VDVDGAHAGPDGAGHLVHQPGIEGGASGKRAGKHAGCPGEEAGQALLVSDGGDAEPVRGHDLRLQLSQGAGGIGGLHGLGSRTPG
jgi:hypothetical protein